MKQGTPKTLTEAIANGLSKLDASLPINAAAKVVTIDVQDFLSQHFTAASLEHQGSEIAILDLWKRITKESA